MCWAIGNTGRKEKVMAAENKVLDSASFRVYGKDELLGELDTKAHLKLLKSGAFDYGNGTCVVMEWEMEGTIPQLFDTRYEKGITKDFKKWALDFIQRYIRPELTAEII